MLGMLGKLGMLGMLGMLLPGCTSRRRAIQTPPPSGCSRRTPPMRPTWSPPAAPSTW